MKIINIRKIRKAQARYDAAPDVDMDFESAGRDWVKKYIERKYGKENVCSLATYGRLQIRAAIKDIGKVEGLDYNFVNKVTKLIFGNSWEDLAESISKNDKVRDFVEEYPDIMEIVERCLGQVRHSSIHPAGVIISPAFRKTKKGKKVKAHLDDFIPIKLMKGKGLSDEKEFVSEWEGVYVERRGLLKVDILGIRQLDIFKYISLLVYKNYKIKIDFNDIPLDDKNVFDKFKSGDTEGVFQFKSYTQKSYQKRLQADNLEHLIASNALLRPGAMASKAHMKYIDIKNGKEKPFYDPGLEEVTKNTFGLYIYQEQIMKAMTVGGGMSLAEADVIRTAIKHFDKKIMGGFKNKFIAGIKMLHDYDDINAKIVWDKLMAFSGYGFNRSHSCSYAILGYWCQYLKTYYSKEFWAANLEYASETDRVEYINRILLSYKNVVDIVFPDINLSRIRFYLKKDKLIWSLSHIKGVGEKAALAIIKARKDGEFKNLEDTYRRVEKRVVNKRVFVALIYSGAFDDFYDIEKPEERFKIIVEYFKIKKEKIVLKKEAQEFYDFEYSRLLGVNLINWEKLVEKKKINTNIYVEIDKLDDIADDTDVFVLGSVVRFFEKESVNGMYCKIWIQQNGAECMLHLWNEVWEQYREPNTKVKIGKIIGIRGEKEYDGKYNHINTIKAFKDSKIITF